MKIRLLSTAVMLAAVTLTSGCATKQYVRDYVGEQVKPINERLTTLEGRESSTEAKVQDQSGQIASLTTRADNVDGILKSHEQLIQEVSGTAKEALDRAMAAGKLAEGKLLDEVVMTDEQVKFPVDRAALGKEAKAFLDQFADKLKAENKNVYIEIQGHTDSRGSKALNLKLGEERAMAARDYLAMHDGIPLHRMSVISYGESKPIATNMNRAGRAKNRRVVLIVLH